MSRNRVEEPQKKKNSLKVEIILRTINLPEYPNCVIFWFVALPRLVGELHRYGVARCLHLTLTLKTEETRHSETEEPPSKSRRPQYKHHGRENFKTTRLLYFSFRRSSTHINLTHMCFISST